MKRILITGASGFIGGFLAEEGLNRGWEVTAAVRPTSDRRWLQDKRIRFLELNFRNEADLQEKLKNSGRFDFIIHNAGSTKEPNREGYFASNFDNTKRFADTLLNHELIPEKFLYVSSLAAVGPVRYDQLLKPGQTPRPVTFYGESKLASEQYLASLNDFPWTAVQPTAVFGPREKGIYLAIKLAAQGWAFLLGNQPQQLSFIYVKDLVHLMYAALERGHSGKKYLVTDGKTYSNTELGKAVEAVTKRRTIQVKVPLPVVRAVAGISEIAGKWRGEMPPLNREKLPELIAESWICDTSETFGDLQFRPRYDLYTGMEETVQWYKDNRWL
ncbi:MAG: NAD(P)-dependent oxidoreductase [Haliscomenobacteraceae bacterium CHB4]|nr:ADP-L-glycero-D-manno-heptose-6-epimerase [Saprospiraceae bacterium]MCE7924439.1 NAD(P)-dependent oxidoreductase [Haliscomenobacteraceae bacterium CHB4]